MYTCQCERDSVQQLSLSACCLFVCVCSRNPEGKERPTFSEVVQMLQAVEASVLITQDKGKMKSTSLGQPLKAGYNLYKDLQEMYM